MSCSQVPGPVPCSTGDMVGNKASDGTKSGLRAYHEPEGLCGISSKKIPKIPNRHVAVYP